MARGSDTRERGVDLLMMADLPPEEVARRALQLTCQDVRRACDICRVLDALATAFDRIDDFVSVQRAAGGITVESVELLQRAAGLEGEERAVISARAAALGVPADTLLLGIIVARLAA